MGTSHSKQDPQTTPLPLGHVPYTPSLPAAMGSLENFPFQWWYYGGWAKDTTGKKEFSILLFSLKVLIDSGIVFGIGMKDSDSTDTTYKSKTKQFGFGEFPAPTSTSWSTKIISACGGTTLSCTLTDGTLGVAGAKYDVDFKDEDEENSLVVSLKLESTIGLMLEGLAGALPGIGAVQFGMPAMTIQEGSTITKNGEKTVLAEGNIWLERQSLKWYNILNPIYVGNWLAITMNDGTSYTISFYWKEKQDQWISGTAVHHPPVNKTAIEYPVFKNWRKSLTPIQGSNILAQDDFDLNIFPPSDPKLPSNWQSHWQSKNGPKNTYATAWKLKLKGHIYTLKALIPEAEVHLMTYFYEGCAGIYDEKSVLVGHAVVEQMGYN